MFADLRKVMDAPEEVMQQLFADAQAMSSRTGKSFEDIVTIMTAAAQAGLGKTREGCWAWPTGHENVHRLGRQRRAGGQVAGHMAGSYGPHGGAVAPYG